MFEAEKVLLLLVILLSDKHSLVVFSQDSCFQYLYTPSQNNIDDVKTIVIEYMLRTKKNKQ